MKKKEVQMLKLALIDADPEQPRKNFNAERLGQLISSIKKHGIMNPLIVEEKKGGRFILVDGERRYRSAKELKLTEVPAIVHAPQSDAHRLIEQFHIQEQHEGWTAMEKAVAIVKLAEVMEMNITDIANLLDLPRSTITDYSAFGKLLERKQFEKTESSVRYARDIVNVRVATKRAWLKHDKEFTEDMERELETAIIARLKKGEIKRPADIIKIKDAVNTDYMSIKKFIESDMTIDRLFISSSAKQAAAARNLLFSASFIQKYARDLKVTNGLSMIEDKASQTTLKTALEVLKELVK